MSEKKLMVGHKLRRLRQEHGLTQAQMADEIGISTSYLNLIERRSGRRRAGRAWGNLKSRRVSRGA